MAEHVPLSRARLQIHQAWGALVEAWALLRRRPVLLVVLVAPAFVSGLLLSMATEGRGGSSWVAIVLGWLKDYGVLLVAAGMGRWVMDELLEGTPPAWPAFRTAVAGSWRPLFFLYVVQVLMGVLVSEITWGRADSDTTILRVWVNWCVWINVMFHYAVLFFLWAWLPAVLVKGSVRGGLGLSVGFLKRHSGLAFLLLLVFVGWCEWGLPFLGRKTFHWGELWFQNPFWDPPRLRSAVFGLVGAVVGGYFQMVQFVSVFLRWQEEGWEQAPPPLGNEFMLKQMVE